MAGYKVLIVEDDHDIRELIEYNLKREDFQVHSIDSGEEAISAALLFRPDLVILDLMLPGLGGLDVCRKLKHDMDLANTPVLMVSAKGEESDVVTGLELGADDYLTKPFSPRVLIARVRAVLRRHETQSRHEIQAKAPATSVLLPIQIERLKVDPRRHEAQIDGEPLNLTATEYRILHYLAQNPGWVFTRQQLVKNLHGSEGPKVTERSIDVQIAGLRKKLGDSSDYIETVRGIGYRLRMAA